MNIEMNLFVIHSHVSWSLTRSNDDCWKKRNLTSCPPRINSDKWRLHRNKPSRTSWMPTSTFLFTNNQPVSDTSVDSHIKIMPCRHVGDSCYFRGLSRYHIVNCPAKEAVCKEYGEKGGFSTTPTNAQRKKTYASPVLCYVVRGLHYPVCRRWGHPTLPLKYCYPCNCQRSHTTRIH